MRYAIYFLHAFPLSSEMWENQIRYFSSKAKVVALDYPGFGGTDDSPIPENNPSLEDFAEFVEDQIRKTSDESEKIVLVGLSMGGYIAQYIIKRKKINVDSVILANTRSQADSDEARKKRIELIESSKKSVSIKPILDFYLPILSNNDEKLIDKISKMANKARLGGVIKALHAMAFREDTTEIVKKFKNKLIIAGSKDKLSPPEVMISMTGNKNELKIIESGHLSAMEKPDEFNKSIEEFLFSRKNN